MELVLERASCAIGGRGERVGLPSSWESTRFPHKTVMPDMELYESVLSFLVFYCFCEIIPCYATALPFSSIHVYSGPFGGLLFDILVDHVEDIT